MPEPADLSRRVAGVGRRLRAGVAASASVVAGSAARVGAWAEGARAAPGAAGEDDIRAAYRLLLGRVPDPDGLAYWRERADELPVASLVSGIMDSREFKSGPICAHLLATTGAGAGGGSGYELVEANGLTYAIDPDDTYVSRVIAETGAYEPHLTPAVEASLPPDGTFLDVGANIGWFSLMAARAVGPGGRVVAFDAQPTNIDLLLRGAQASGLANVVALPVALSERVGGAVLQRLGGTNGALFDADAGNVAGDVRVTCVPLDLFAELFERLDVVKIDVEGAELPALLGGERLIRRYRPIIFMEFSPKTIELSADRTLDQFQAWVDDHGYATSVLGLDHSQGIVDVPDLAAVVAMVTERRLQHVDLKLSPG